ncbi:MAG: RNA polymerase sigma-70 factor (ECF subfamily) [Hyphomicrobiaceae bacterium]
MPFATVPGRTEPSRPQVPDAIEVFVTTHQTALWRFLRLLGCAGLRAEEVAQDALIIGLQRQQQHEEPTRAAAFLRRTARHLWLRAQRADRRRAARHAKAAELLWADEMVHDDGAGWLEALDRCLEELPARSRLALDRTYRDGLGRLELGMELGIGELGVSTLLLRLRTALRGCIERRRKP